MGNEFAELQHCLEATIANYDETRIENAKLEVENGKQKIRIVELENKQDMLLAALERAEQTVRNLAANIPPGKDIWRIAKNEAENLRADIAAAKPVPHEDAGGGE